MFCISSDKSAERSELGFYVHSRLFTHSMTTSNKATFHVLQAELAQPQSTVRHFRVLLRVGCGIPSIDIVISKADRLNAGRYGECTRRGVLGGGHGRPHRAASHELVGTKRRIMRQIGLLKKQSISEWAEGVAWWRRGRE